MKSKIKRILAILLIVSFVVTVTAAAVSAEPEPGHDTGMGNLGKSQGSDFTSNNGNAYGAGVNGHSQSPNLQHGG